MGFVTLQTVSSTEIIKKGSATGLSPPSSFTDLTAITPNLEFVEEHSNA